MFEIVDFENMSGMSNTGNIIQKLVARINHNFDLIADKNYLYIKDELYYSRIEKEAFIRDFMNLFFRMMNELGDGYRGTSWRSKYGKEAWKTITLQNYTEDIDNYPHLIPFANGVYNINNKSFSPSFEENLVEHFPFDYVEYPRCPMFYSALCEILPNRKDRDWFLTFINYAFSGSIKYQVACIMKGNGNNGKTALGEFIIRLMGNRATTAKINKLNDDNYRVNTKGKTLCYSSEVGGSYLNQDMQEHLKETITEEYKSGRKVYQKLEEWENTTKYLCATNNLPKLHSFKKAFLRRFKIIHFPTDFTGREDRTLFDRIYKEEGGAVLSWILQAYQNWDKLTVDWQETNNIWRYSSDNVKRFIDEQVIDMYGKSVETNILYKSYVQYCINEEETPISFKYFGRRMTKLGYPAERNDIGNWVYKSIYLRDFKAIEEISV
jgi:P4 family phage/plasmid primase-like protien